MNFASRVFLPLFLHPLLILVAFLIFGIFLQATYSLPIIVALIPIAMSAILFFYPFHTISWRLIAICALCGYSIGAYRITQQMRYRDHLVQQICNKKIDCIGTITDLQLSHDRSSKSKITLRLARVRFIPETTWQDIDTSVLLFARRAPTDVAVGDVIQLDSIQLKHSKSNQSFNNYLLKEGVVATAFLQNATYRVLQPSSGGLGNWISEQRSALVNRLRNRFCQGTLALFTSLFLGNRSEEKQEQEVIAQQSKNWGTSHHLARSGLHLVIFIYLLASLLRFLPISLFAKEILLLVLCIIYHIFSWSSVSFMRAFITFLLYKTCTLLQFPSHVLHILTLTCGIILFVNPIQLFFLDFQLSFGLTFILAWFNAAYQGKRE